MAWIDKLVSRSPIGPMQEHMRAAVACAHQVVPLVEAMVSGDAEAIREKRAQDPAIRGEKLNSNVGRLAKWKIRNSEPTVRKNRDVERQVNKSTAHDPALELTVLIQPRDAAHLLLLFALGREQEQNAPVAIVGEPERAAQLGVQFHVAGKGSVARETTDRSALRLRNPELAFDARGSVGVEVSAERVGQDAPEHAVVAEALDGELLVAAGTHDNCRRLPTSTTTLATNGVKRFPPSW